MNLTATIVWGCLLFGVVLAVVLGKSARRWGARMSTSFGIGLVVSFLLNGALPICVEAKRCPALGEAGIVYVLYPLLAIPVFYALARLAAASNNDE